MNSRYKKATIIYSVFITGILIMFPVSFVSAQNFNDPETVSSWSLTTQEPIDNSATQSSIDEGLDMWNIQQAIALAEAEEEISPDPTPTPTPDPTPTPIIQNTESSGSGRGGRLGTANYSLRNRSELATIARTIAKAETESKMQHASAPKADNEELVEVPSQIPTTEIITPEEKPEEVEFPMQNNETKNIFPVEEIPTVSTNTSSQKAKEILIPVEEILSEKIIPISKKNTVIKEKNIKNIIDAPEAEIIINDEIKNTSQLLSSTHIDEDIMGYNTEIQKQESRTQFLFLLKILFEGLILIFGGIVLFKTKFISQNIKKIRTYFQ